MNPKYLPKRKRRKPRFVPIEKPPSTEGDHYYKEEEGDEEQIDYNKVVEDLFEAKNRLKMEQIQNAVFEDNEVKEHLYRLISGEDAISFFAKYGDSTPIKFIN